MSRHDEMDEYILNSVEEIQTVSQNSHDSLPLDQEFVNVSLSVRLL